MKHSKIRKFVLNKTEYYWSVIETDKKLILKIQEGNSGRVIKKEFPPGVQIAPKDVFKAIVSAKDDKS